MEVETASGRVRGVRKGGVTVFWGIPYAEAPIGGLRFARPEPRRPWSGVFDATSPPPAAPHVPSEIGAVIGLSSEHQSEDCLHASVWAPDGEASGRPVMVWVHGGGFEAGHAAHAMANAAALAARAGVVIVSLQYRLGAVGFLSVEGAPENRGLWDVVLGLRWVRDNAARFGGDPDNVTVFGSSAGAIALGVLLAAPATEGLFHRAILQSGHVEYVHEPAAARAVRAAFFEDLGAAPSLAELEAAPIEALLAAQRATSDRLAASVVGTPFQPVVDGDLLPRHPLGAIRDGASRSVPLLVGTNRDEMRLLALRDLMSDDLEETRLSANCKELLGLDDEAVERVVARYRPGHARVRDAWYAIATDVHFRIPSLRLLDAHVQAGGRAHAYLLARPAPGMGGLLGACHAMEIPLVFGTFREPLPAMMLGDEEEVREFSEGMQDAWGAFARAGDPSTRATGPWAPYGASRAIMVLDEDSAMTHAAFADERALWEPLWGGLRAVGAV